MANVTQAANFPGLRGSPLAPRDIAVFAAIKVGEDLLARAQITRVTDAEGRDVLGLNGRSGDMSGILIPYLDPESGRPTNYAVRRDNPEMEDGKPRGKYLFAFGNR